MKPVFVSKDKMLKSDVEGMPVVGIHLADDPQDPKKINYHIYIDQDFVDFMLTQDAKFRKEFIVSITGMTKDSLEKSFEVQFQ